MTEIVKDMFDPIYWATVVPIGTAFLAAMWMRYDSKKESRE